MSEPEKEAPMVNSVAGAVQHAEDDTRRNRRGGSGSPTTPEQGGAAAAHLPARRGSRRSLALVARYAALIFVFVASVGPFLWQLSTSLKSTSEDIYTSGLQLIPQEPTLSNYTRVAETIDVFGYSINSLIYAVISVVGNCVGAALAGYALARVNFRFQPIVLGLFLTALILPAEVTIMSQYQTIRTLGLANTLLGVALPGAISALNVLLMFNAFRAIPKELDEAAILDGANMWKRFTKIGVPSVRGTISVVAIFAFVGAWDDFLWPLIVLQDPSRLTLTVGLNYLNSAFGSDPRLIAAGTMIVLLPILLFFIVLQRHFFKGVGEGAVKG